MTVRPLASVLREDAAPIRAGNVSEPSAAPSGPRRQHASPRRYAARWRVKQPSGSFKDRPLLTLSRRALGIFLQRFEMRVEPNLRDQRRDDGARDHGRQQDCVLVLVDDVVGQTE